MQINKYALFAILLLVLFFVFRSCGTEVHAGTATMNVGATVVASAAVGKTLFATECLDCHEAVDLAGVSVEDIQKSLGVAKMKNIKLSTKQMQDLEAYLKTL